jgi:hypothetical protein
MEGGYAGFRKTSVACFAVHGVGSSCVASDRACFGRRCGIAAIRRYTPGGRSGGAPERGDVRPGARVVQGMISVTPNTVDTGASNAVTITTSGFFDLSQVTPSQIQVRPADGVSNFAISEQSAQHLALSFDVADTAAPGTRTLSISNSGGGPSVALDLTLKIGQNVCIPNCVSPAVCMSNQCVTHTPPAQCNPACQEESSCVNGRCVDSCNPHCTGGMVCVNDAGHFICKHAS